MLTVQATQGRLVGHQDRRHGLKRPAPGQVPLHLIGPEDRLRRPNRFRPSLQHR